MKTIRTLERDRNGEQQAIRTPQIVSPELGGCASRCS
jgi:hypothetical protein